MFAAPEQGDPPGDHLRGWMSREKKGDVLLLDPSFGGETSPHLVPAKSPAYKLPRPSELSAQVEVNRALYINEETRVKLPSSFGTLKQNLGLVAAALAVELRARVVDLE